QTVRIRHDGLVPRQGQQVQEVRLPTRDLRPARTDGEGEPVLQRAVPPLSSRDTLIFGGPSGRVAKPRLEARIRPAGPGDFAACAFDAPRPPRGTVRCVVASLDLRAQALYVKFGMLPRTTLYYVDGKPTKSTVGGVELRQLGPAGISTQRARDLAARFDRRLREAHRDADQRYFVTTVKGSRFFEARAGGRAVGYVVIRGNGAIGPGGVRDPSLSAGLMSAAIAKAHENGMKTVSAWVPGLNGGALKAAFGAGL